MSNWESFQEFSSRFEPASQIPRLLIEGNREMVVEGYQHILSYEEHAIQIALRHIGIKIHGTDLCIRSFTRDVLVITGTLNKVEYLDLEEQS